MKTLFEISLTKIKKLIIMGLLPYSKFETFPLYYQKLIEIKLEEYDRSKLDCIIMDSLSDLIFNKANNYPIITEKILEITPWNKNYIKLHQDIYSSQVNIYISG
uniref:Uncharacterized protein n=1 Tax=viral metagenome TaxID=1070528 RepID=A0A6C0JCV8_9ZZZZ